MAGRSMTGQKAQIWRTVTGGNDDAKAVEAARAAAALRAMWEADARDGSKFPRRAIFARRMLLAHFEKSGRPN
jgi:hypothetical protein